YALRTAYNIRNEHDRATRSTLAIDQRQRCGFHHVTFSTKTRMVPPHERPTRHAVSSATPNSIKRGLPLCITSSASVTTAPSTHPPDTEPRKSPASLTIKDEPAGRGADPHVSITVAIATSRPASRHCC